MLPQRFTALLLLLLLLPLPLRCECRVDCEYVEEVDEEDDEAEGATLEVEALMTERA